jgi:hypothetical protein
MAFGSYGLKRSSGLGFLGNFQGDYWGEKGLEN